MGTQLKEMETFDLLSSVADTLKEYHKEKTSLAFPVGESFSFMQDSAEHKAIITYVYENLRLSADWVSSTRISDRNTLPPTMPARLTFKYGFDGLFPTTRILITVMNMSSKVSFGTYEDFNEVIPLANKHTQLLTPATSSTEPVTKFPCLKIYKGFKDEEFWLDENNLAEFLNNMKNVIQTFCSNRRTALQEKYKGLTWKLS